MLDLERVTAEIREQAGNVDGAVDRLSVVIDEVELLGSQPVRDAADEYFQVVSDLVDLVGDVLLSSNGLREQLATLEARGETVDERFRKAVAEELGIGRGVPQLSASPCQSRKVGSDRQDRSERGRGVNATDYIAIYAAVVATGGLGWEIRKARQARRPQIEVVVSFAVLGYLRGEPTNSAHIEVRNRGDIPVRVTSVGFKVQDHSDRIAAIHWQQPGATLRSTRSRGRCSRGSPLQPGSTRAWG